jgi:hypothetical protein
VRIAYDGLARIQPEICQSLPRNVWEALDDPRRAAPIPYNFRTGTGSFTVSKAKLLILLALPRGHEGANKKCPSNLNYFNVLPVGLIPPAYPTVKAASGHIGGP